MLRTMNGEFPDRLYILMCDPGFRLHTKTDQIVMTFLIDLLHPAHVHFFRHVHASLVADGHTVVVTAREKDCTIPLLDSLGIGHRTISRQGRGIIGLVTEMAIRTVRLVLLCRRYRPDLMMGIMGPGIAVAGRLMDIPRWIFYDTENATLTNKVVYPLATRVYTPACYRGLVPHQVTYRGYHELAYLHPHHFRPNPDILRHYGVAPGEPYSLLRFVAWNSSHDLKETGLSDRQKEKLVEQLMNHGRVFVSAEGRLPRSMGALEIPCSRADIHHFIAHARVVVGESATMVSEAAVLGVPAVFISNTFRGYTIDEEKRYGLVRNFQVREFERALEYIRSLLNDGTSLKNAARARKKLLSENVDVSDFILRQIARMEKSACVE